jgi:hypothetical protein
MTASRHQLLDVRVTPTAFTHAPATVRVVATIEPDPANAGLGFVIDGDNYYSSGVLEREQLRPQNVREFRDMPPGDYAVGVVLYRDGPTGLREAARVTRDVHVVF